MTAKRLFTLLVFFGTLLLYTTLTACKDGRRQHEADIMLQRAQTLFEARQYDRALIVIDSLRKVYPNAIDARKQALKLHQDIELTRAQEELAVADSALQAVSRDYEQQKRQAEADILALKAKPDQLTRLTKMRVRRDSLQTQFDVLCAKIRYIHKKQREQQE